MAILKINTYPDAVLKQKALPVTTFDAKLAQLAQDMLETMYDAPGVGLAANQVGVLQRILVIDVDYEIDAKEGEEDPALRQYKNKNPKVIVNPVIGKKAGSILFKEGCLSVPGFYEEVKRSKTLDLQYQDLKGQPQRLAAEGFLAVAIQHEIDHLNGLLFVDHLSPVKKSLIQGKVKKERAHGFERSKFHVEL